MAVDRSSSPSDLVSLEAAVRRRAKWRGRPVFYLVLEADLAPILAAAADPAAVRDQVRAMLVRLGHAPEAPPASGRVSRDAAPLCIPPRS